jgi:transposase
MRYCGIDLGGMSSYVYITDRLGRKLKCEPVPTTKDGFKRSLGPSLREGLKIAIEAGNQTAWVYECLKELGAEVVVVHPKRVKLIAESRKKTDKVDAKILCELLRLDGLPQPVHMPGESARALRGLLVARQQLIAARTKLCNVVRGMLRQEGTRLKSRALGTRIGWQRVMAQGFQHEHVMQITATYFDTFVALCSSIKEIDSQLHVQAKTDPGARRLQQMPKVGPIASLTFVAAVDDIQRFPSSRKLVGYTGLAPKVRQSSERTEYGEITREGRKELRAVWVQIAHLVARDRKRDTQPLRSWFNRMAKRRGKKTALVALARKLLTIAYHLLKYEQDYDPRCLKRAA